MIKVITTAAAHLLKYPVQSYFVFPAAPSSPKISALIHCLNNAISNLSPIIVYKGTDVRLF